MHGPHPQGADPVAAAHEHGRAHVRPGPRRRVRVLSAFDPAGLIRALDPAYEVAVVDERRLLLQPRTATRQRAVLVVDDALIAWWESLVAVDPEGASATLRHALDAVAAEARPTERYVVRDGDRLTPSLRTRLPAVRDMSPSPEGGQWVAYVPIERDEWGDPDPRAR